MNKQLYCRNHTDQLAEFYLEDEIRIEGFFCITCSQEQKGQQFLSIDSLFHRLGENYENCLKDSQKNQLKYESLSAILFCKDEFMTAFTQHIEQQQLLIDETIDELKMKLENILFTLRFEARAALQKEVSQFELEFQKFDELLSLVTANLKLTGIPLRTEDLKNSFAELSNIKECREFLKQIQRQNEVLINEEKKIRNLMNRLTIFNKNMNNSVAKRPVLNSKIFQELFEKMGDDVTQTQLLVQDSIILSILARNQFIPLSQDNFKFDESKNTITKLSKQSWKCCYLAEKIPMDKFKFALCLESSPSLMFGIVSQENLQKGSEHVFYNSDTYLISNVGQFCVNGVYKQNGKELSKMDVVEIETNLEDRSITFFLNGKKIKSHENFVFKDINYHLVILMYHANTVVRVIET